MKIRGIRSTALLLGAVIASAGHAEWIPTNIGNGADAEVRESNPTQNRGDSTEIGTRARNDYIAGDGNDGSDRNSAIYTRFDLSQALIPNTFETAFSLTYRNSNLNGTRIQDTITPNPAVRTGLAIYGLAPGIDWQENSITYLTAPGLFFDGDVGSVDVTSDLTFLGTVEFPEIGAQNWLPVGGELRFCSDNLDQFVNNALDLGYSEVTLVSMRIHSGDTPFANWTNFNYLFNPKEQTTLNDDPNYDDGHGNIGSPFSGADNSNGEFSPALAIVDKASLATADLCTFGAFNQPPDCASAAPSEDVIWPANGNFVPVNVTGITDGDGDAVTVTIDSIFQDEPTSNDVGLGSLSPDGSGLGTDTAYLRAERSPQGNGRVYTVAYTADDGNGGQCSALVTVSVPKGDDDAVDNGAVYDSTLP